MQLNTKHIAALNTTPAIRIYIYLKNLERLGVFYDELNTFRKGIGITSSYYDDFKQLKSKVIKPAIKEIRMHTDYKDFFIEDNGRPGVKATRIRFGFEKTVDSDIFEGVAPNRAAICRKFPEDVQVSMRLAMDHGFDPLYIEDKFEGIPSERILANFRYVMVEVIGKDKKRGIDKGPAVGKYFLTAVREGWAEKNGKDVSKALSGKRTYREYKLLVKLVTSKMMIQEI